MAGTDPRRLGVRGRSWARRLALQALYQWQLNGQPLEELAQQFSDDHDTRRVDMDYFRELLLGSRRHAEAIEATLAPCLDRPLAQVDPVERAILWIGGYELAHRLDIPYRVILNEGVELAKAFGAEQSHRFINGVLDQAARQWRVHEVKSPAP
ncbi:MAG: transcription antitermination factor NusB [Candidatus Competibacterales bacterium]